MKKELLELLKEAQGAIDLHENMPESMYDSREQLIHRINFALEKYDNDDTETKH